VAGKVPEMSAPPGKRGGRVAVWKTPMMKNNRIRRWTRSGDDGVMLMVEESSKVVISRSGSMSS
jgi:hypothetical protein